MAKEIMLLVVVAVGSISILLILLAYLIARKLLENNRRQQINDLKEKIAQDVFLFLQDRSYELSFSADSNIEKEALEELLTKYSDILEGDQERQSLRILAAANLTGYYRKNVNARKWSTRMNTLYHIESFQLVELKEELIKLAEQEKKRSKEEKIQIYRILASFQYTDIFMLINKQEYLAEKDYRSILTRLEAPIFEEMIARFDECVEELKLAILDVMGVKKDLEHITFLENVFQTYEGELRLRSLKAISNIGIVSNIDNYFPLCQSSVWQERMMAARLLGFAKQETALKLLKELLHDQSWFVRSQAAESIMKYKDGTKVLEEVLQHSKDAFARDMAWEWVNKGILKGAN
ncbi:HEAT repeat domain-containing protein [Niallia sp. SS-2023]|uniref:HEAT repeat domain-containing protein n=1 Tax=Niallia sp. SS-2023 TaxID=3051155 RepID=UPI00254A22F6|nr:HEAT repeat domain-containing protein [Niallia sp. SS-2023]MDL0436848.1 HEAT repeat domain-containing protein [Niallia sp. SS-2023]